MVYAHKVCRVTISGTMFGGAEEWSTGFFLGFDSSDSTAPTQQGADDILAAWTTFFSASGSLISNRYATTQVKLSSLNTAGDTLADETKYAYPATALVGATTSTTLPPQCSLVVTLKSTIAHGRGSKGRMYLPGISVIIGTDGKVASTSVGTIATNLQSFFNLMGNDADLPGRLILASKAPNILGVGAFNQNVTSIAVGDVIDTQRRRRNGLSEVYTTKALSL